MHNRPITTHEAHNILSSLPTINKYTPKTHDYLKHFKLTKSHTDDIRSLLSPHFDEEKIAILGSLLPTSVEELKMYVKTDVEDEVLGILVARMSALME